MPRRAVKAGDIYKLRDPKTKEGRRYRIVVYSIDKRGNIFYDQLAPERGAEGGGICYGSQSEVVFLRDWELDSVMRFEGAYQLYMRERKKVGRARRLLNHVADQAKRSFEKQDDV